MSSESSAPNSRLHKQSTALKPHPQPTTTTLLLPSHHKPKSKTSSNPHSKPPKINTATNIKESNTTRLHPPPTNSPSTHSCSNTCFFPISSSITHVSTKNTNTSFFFSPCLPISFSSVTFNKEDEYTSSSVKSISLSPSQNPRPLLMINDLEICVRVCLILRLCVRM
ncbi:hypothetical protein Droror1_Dr00020136 [Drosera rotundifolia]